MVRFRHKGMVVKGRPGLKEDIAESEETRSRQFLKQYASTILIASFFIIPNLSAMLWPYVSGLLDYGNSTYFPSSSEPEFEPHIPIQSHQRASLLEKYQVNYAEVMKIRKDNMKRYGYNYNMFGIDKRSDLSLQEYRDVYDGKWPVVVTDVIPKWKAYNWSREFFMEKYGQERVTMKAVDKVLDTAIQDMLPLFNHLDEDLNGEQKSSLDSAVSLALPLELFYKNTHKAYPNSWTYIEDELFIPMRPELRNDIGECIYMNEDYYKLFPLEIRPWDAMLLWGTEFSRSSLHMDPYNWTGTNAVIKGRKRWRLYPPGQDHFLYVIPGKTSGFPLDSTKYNSPIDAYEPNMEKYPLFAKATAIEFDQLPGELLFIPTGWFHQAFNVEETIAISSQMMNRNNHRIVLEEILKVNDVKRKDLPTNIDAMAPDEQVKTIMSLLPESLLKRGKAVTQDIIQQVQNVGERKPNTVPLG